MVVNESTRDFAAVYNVIYPDYRYTGEYQCFYEDHPSLLNKVYVFVSGKFRFVYC